MIPPDVEFSQAFLDPCPPSHAFPSKILVALYKARRSKLKLSVQTPRSTSLLGSNIKNDVRSICNMSIAPSEPPTHWRMNWCFRAHNRNNKVSSIIL